MTAFITKTIGNDGGRDFVNWKAFADWLNVRNLVTNDEMITAEFHTNVLDTDLSNLVPLDHDATRYCILKPAAGKGINDLDPSGLLYYGTTGIEVTIPSGKNLRVSAGVSIQGFRINSPGTYTTGGRLAVVLAAASGILVKRSPEFKYNRVQLSHTGGVTNFFIETGNQSSPSTITDNIFIHTAGDGATLLANYKCILLRNTFVRVGTAEGITTLRYDITTMRDNALIGCGLIPAIKGNNTVAADVSNNVLSTAPTTALPGFTVSSAAAMVVNPANDLRPVAAGALVGTGHNSSNKTKDLRGSYRGSAPDVGAIQLTSQPLPPLVASVITSFEITDQTVVVKGTYTGETLSGMFSVSKSGVVQRGPVALTLDNGNFTARLEHLPSGQYDAPLVTITNDAGVKSATGANTFVIAPEIIPIAVITKQYIMGNKVLIRGTILNEAVTGTLTLSEASVPNGATGQGPVPVTITGNTFTVALNNVSAGNYKSPVLVFTNPAGSSQAASNATPIVIRPVAVTPISGVTIRTIGAGKDHPDLKAFGTWLNTRDLVANNEIVYAYVYDDQTIANTANFNMYSANFDASHYCVIKPPPGYSVNDHHTDEPFDYGELGVELNFSNNSQARLYGGVVIEGFRITVHDAAAPGTALFTNRAGTQNTLLFKATFRKNRVRSYQSILGSCALMTGNSDADTEVSDNIFIQENGVGYAVDLRYRGDLLRNTFVRCGSARGTTAVKSNGRTATLLSNAFVQASDVPVLFGYAPGQSSNNVTDTVLGNGALTSGFIVGANLVNSIVNDFRPSQTSALIAAADNTAISTNDIVGRNRGPQPDAGAWQRTPFISMTEIDMVSDRILGQSLEISGTTKYNPTEATLTLKPAGTNSGTAVLIENVAITLTDGAFNVRVDGIYPGNYAAPELTFVNAGGTITHKTSPVSILRISGQPQAPGLPPEIEITSAIIENGVLEAVGLVEVNGDDMSTISAYLEPVPTNAGAILGPFNVNYGIDGSWIFSRSNLVGTYRLRVTVTTSDAQSDTEVTGNLSIPIIVSGLPSLPLF